MGRRGEWIPPEAPLGEGYWRALLRDGEAASAAPAVSPTEVWRNRAPESGTAPEQTAESSDVEDPWERARHLMAVERTMELPVVGCNRGGLLVAWNGLTGFVPASHLLELTPVADERERRKAMEEYIGSRLPLQIIELDRDRERFVLSERAAQIDSQEGEGLLDQLEPGEICQGRVTSLCSFGAFIDLGGFEGLAHISELSWGRVGHPREVLEPGEMVGVYVLNVDPKRERVALSIKRLQPNPWESVEERYAVGQMLEGRVSHVVDFGAFVQIEKGLEGLIHVSELQPGNPCDPRDLLRAGDQVSVTVLSIDGGRQRMGLRLDERQSTTATASALSEGAETPLRASEEHERQI